jgi:NOL1/NOP2/fmu family ribosome biogenesis protein/23S rRNA U2552 (ribose-2'-O)-methylase RlmE/FtsJ
MEWQPLEPVPWCPGGFYYGEAVRPGKHSYHAAGVYYIQEPSAMSAVPLLDPQPGETVLDLAAAPGGKSTQIAGAMMGKGMLVTNEIHPARAKILAENVERMGIAGAVVTNETPDRLAERFPRFFDRIMVDAPCSGEGMFRKDPEAMKVWSPDQVTVCARRQEDILEQAVKMLKPGGTIAYSTCTFSPEENEDVVRELAARVPELSLLRTERIWPHLARGEGHFVAVLQLAADDAPAGSGRAGIAKGKPAPGSAKPLAQAVQLYRDFARAALPGFTLGPGEPVLFGEQLYWLPHAEGGLFGSAHLHGLKVVRPGLHLGTVRTGRLEPAHALALAAKPEQARNVRSFPAEADAIRAYLRGETLESGDGAPGWTLVCVDGFPLGWGKTSGGQLKNHYPKGLRWLP